MLSKGTAAKDDPLKTDFILYCEGIDSDPSHDGDGNGADACLFWCRRLR